LINIRVERPEDYQAIYDLNRKAFQRDSEAELVRKLRRSEHFIPELSLVAEKDGKVAGHILFYQVNC